MPGVGAAGNCHALVAGSGGSTTVVQTLDLMHAMLQGGVVPETDGQTSDRYPDDRVESRWRCTYGRQEEEKEKEKKKKKKTLVQTEGRFQR